MTGQDALGDEPISRLLDGLLQICCKEYDRVANEPMYIKIKDEMDRREILYLGHSDALYKLLRLDNLRKQSVTQ